MTSEDLQSIIQGIESDAKLEALSQVAEAAERYEDMVAIMNALVKKKLEVKESLTLDMRNLLSVAYKNVVGAKRSSWRMLTDENMQVDVKPDILTKYQKQVESELDKICQEVLQILKQLSVQNNVKLEEENDDTTQNELNECQVFYLKMIGDYYRYLTEAFKDNEEYKENCSKNYAEAMELAKKTLEPTHPTRLGLALNFSVCYYEILSQKDEACKLAKTAFDEAIEKLDSLNDASYKDSTLIMQLLRDNLTIWNQADENVERE